VSEKKEDGGPAFPYDARVDEKTWRPVNAGMSLRDYFAIHSLSSIKYDENNFLWERTADGIAKSAYAIADAMLKERNK
jgi:hypothetical protein